MWQEKLQSVLDRWRGTPWVAGQQCCGVGVDCVRFVIAVLDELYGLKLPPLPRWAQDVSLHDRVGAMKIMRIVSSRYPHESAAGKSIEPGDIVVFRSGAKGGPGHVAIAGAAPGVLWHAAAPVGVCTTAVGAFKLVEHVWRPLEKESWPSH